MQAHHVFPQRFVNDFKDIGIEIHNPINGTWVDASHQSWSAAYNQAWANFFSANTNPTCPPSNSVRKSFSPRIWLHIELLKGEML